MDIFKSVAEGKNFICPDFKEEEPKIMLEGDWGSPDNSYFVMRVLKCDDNNK